MPVDPLVEHAGTYDDPKTIREALIQAEDYSSYSASPSYYFYGVVSQIAQGVGSSGDLYQVMVKDEGTDYEIVIYYLAKSPDRSVVFTSVDELPLYSTLLFYGSPFTYSNGTKEFSNSSKSAPNTYAVLINGNPAY